MAAGAGFMAAGGLATLGFTVPVAGQVALGVVGIALTGVAVYQAVETMQNNNGASHNAEQPVPNFAFGNQLELPYFQVVHTAPTPQVIPPEFSAMPASGVSPMANSPTQIRETIEADMHARNQSIMNTAVAEARSFAASFELAGLKPEMLPEAWFQLAPGSNTWEASTELTNRAINEIASLHNSNDNNATRTVVFPYLTPSGVTIPLIVTGTSDQLTPWLYQSDVFLSSHLQASGILQSWFEPAELPAMPSGEVPQSILNTAAINLIRENAISTNRMSSMEPTAIVQINNEFYSLSDSKANLTHYFETLIATGVVTLASLSEDLRASGLDPQVFGCGSTAGSSRHLQPDGIATASPASPTGTVSPLITVTLPSTVTPASTVTNATPTPPSPPQRPMAVYMPPREAEPLLPESVQELVENLPEAREINVTQEEAISYLREAIEQMALAESASYNENHDRGWREPFDNLAGRITGAGLNSQLAREQGAIYKQILEELQNGSLTPAQAMQAAQELNRLAAAAGGEVAEAREATANTALSMAEATALILSAKVAVPLASAVAVSSRLTFLARMLQHPLAAPGVELVGSLPVTLASIFQRQLYTEGGIQTAPAFLEALGSLAPVGEVFSRIPLLESLVESLTSKQILDFINWVRDDQTNTLLAGIGPSLISEPSEASETIETPESSGEVSEAEEEPVEPLSAELIEELQPEEEIHPSVSAYLLEQIAGLWESGNTK